MDSLTISDTHTAMVRARVLFHAPKPKQVEQASTISAALHDLKMEHANEIKFWIGFSLALGFTAGISVACLVARMAGVL
jgi:hypothetical protein